MIKRLLYIYFIVIFVMVIFPIQPISLKAEHTIYDERLALYKKTEAITHIPWYYIAAIDQYERNRQTNASSEELVSISIPEELWFGIGNHTKMMDEQMIELFSGIGKDGNGDQKADPQHPEDILFTMANLLLATGPSEEDIKIALFNYYQRDLTVKTIMNTSRVFRTFQTLNLSERDFPVSISHNYS